jgi:hypothetical protein
MSTESSNTPLATTAELKIPDPGVAHTAPVTAVARIAAIARNPF